MAYNREWDQGKDAWNSNNQWNENPGAGYAREREEDYHGEGKRRKFNDGVRRSLSLRVQLRLGYAGISRDMMLKLTTPHNGM